MIRLCLAMLIFAAGLCAPVSAQERVTVGTTRDARNGALFLAAARGYFKAEGLKIEMRAYPNPAAAVEALKIGDVALAVTAFSATAFNLAGQGAITAIAAQAREKPGHEGNVVLASVMAFTRGLRKLPNLAGKVAAITELGSEFHYQLGSIAEHEHFSLGGMTLKPLASIDAVVAAVADNKADTAILPALYARDMLLAGQARLVGFYSDIGAQELGALFASAKTLQNRRAMVEKFVRAYRHGAADYAAAFLHYDRHHKRILKTTSQEAGMLIAHYVFPGRNAENAGRAVSDNAYDMDAQARLNLADIAHQIAWYKAQGLIDKKVDAAKVVDSSFAK
jgi:NitT/TauT family transport system substrate-binding protein